MDSIFLTLMLLIYILLGLAFYSYVKFILARERSKFYASLTKAAKKYPGASDILIDIERNYIGKSIFDERQD